MTTGQEPFPTDLCRQIGIMAGKYENNVEVWKDKDWYRKKVYIYATALAQYSRIDRKTKTSPNFYVQDDAKYKWTPPSKYPSYLATDAFKSKAVDHSSDSNWYDYHFSGDVKQTDVYWVDYANAYLGGGAFTAGFLQEETMCCETPDLANLAAWQDKDAHGDWNSHLTTRTPVSKEKVAAVGCGYPTPIVIKGLHRVLNLNAKRNFSPVKFEDKSFEEIRTIVNNGVFPGSPSETFNVIAAAAPNLKTAPTHGAKEEATVIDLFNTFVAMFALAQKQSAAGKNIVVNTGPIGCGDFGNDHIVVYVLQWLAAGHVSLKDHEVALKFWGADAGQVNTAENLVQKITDSRPNSLLDMVKECVKVF
jgi:Poly (ADP-ribose) glycohydrolase (PARG)